MSMPVITPASWGEIGPHQDSELFADRPRERPLVLALTHEETITFHARELRSYRDLPKILYHFQTKGRDELARVAASARARVRDEGRLLVRPRREGLDVAFRAHAKAYERIFSAASSTSSASRRVEMMGGSESFDYLAPSGSGENTLVTASAATS
jgi:prolyl-tRNA synthetase